MSQQIIRQPDGRYAVWSTIVEDFIVLDATTEDIVNHQTARDREENQRNVDRIVTALEAGEKPYFQFTMTWEKALASRREPDDL